MFKQGDKVKAKFNDLITGVVLENEDRGFKSVLVRWDKSGKQIREDADLLVRVPVENDPKVFLYKKGDRVKLKWNKNGGTVLHDQTSPEEHIFVDWDHRDSPLSEKPEDLIALHTPRERDEPHPMQAAIDNIEEERTKLKKQIEDLQFKLGGLTKAKKMLEEGW